MNTKIIEQIKEYSQKHPEASLADYITTLEKEEEKETNRIKANNEWYKGLVGRYFKHGHTFFKVCLDVDDSVYTNKNNLYLEEYNLWIDDDHTILSTSYCDCAVFPYDYFCSPYEDDANRQHPIEISEEIFNKVADKYKELINNVKDFYHNIS